MNERGDGGESGSSSPPPAKKPNMDASHSSAPPAKKPHMDTFHSSAPPAKKPNMDTSSSSTPPVKPNMDASHSSAPSPTKKTSLEPLVSASAPPRTLPATTSNGSTASATATPRLSPAKCLTSPNNSRSRAVHCNGVSSKLLQQQQPNRGESCSPEEEEPSTTTSSRPQQQLTRCKTFAKEKFIPKEELVTQIMDMGICRNGAVKALYWTGNHSALAASNWIFDQPDRDLDTPLEDELEMIRAQQAEREREEHEERQLLRMCRVAAAHEAAAAANHLHHHHHHLHHHHHNLDEEESFDEDELDEEELHEEEEEDEEDEEDLDDIEDEEDLEEEEMDFKMVFVVNKSLELRPGNLALYTSRATVGLYRKINAQPQAVPVGPDELALWGEYGERMVVLWADSDQHIRDLELMARNLQLPCQMIEVKEDGRKAVLGLFGEEREVNKVTGRLKVVS